MSCDIAYVLPVPVAPPEQARSTDLGNTAEPLPKQVPKGGSKPARRTEDQPLLASLESIAKLRVGSDGA